MCLRHVYVMGRYSRGLLLIQPPFGTPVSHGRQRVSAERLILVYEIRFLGHTFVPNIMAAGSTRCNLHLAHRYGRQMVNISQIYIPGSENIWNKVFKNGPSNI